MVRRAGRAEIDCDGRTNREVNAALKRLIAAGERDLIVRNPGARHNLSVADLGNDAVVHELADDDVTFLATTLARYLPAHGRGATRPLSNFRKVVAGRKLWNFDKREWSTWREAL